MPPNRLTAAFVRTVKPTERLKRYGDGNGLYLLVKPGPRGGGKSWVQRLAIHGVRRDLGLGSAELVTLAEARQMAWDNRRIARGGGDPRIAGSRHSPTFAEAVETVIALHRPTWRDRVGTEAQWRASLARHVHPRIGHMPVHAIETADVMAVLAPVWTTRHTTATRVRHRIGAVMKWAVAQGHRPDNPAGEALGAALPKVDAVRTHFRALPHDEVGAALAAVRESVGGLAVRLAFEFMVLCAVRSGEARGARWAEVDREAATWTIPAGRMKAGREHRVPLSRAALAVLDRAAATREDTLVFPSSRPGVPLTAGALGRLLKELGIDAVPHGFRSSFRDWAAERTDTPHAVMEAAANAHAVLGRIPQRRSRCPALDSVEAAPAEIRIPAGVNEVRPGVEFLPVPETVPPFRQSVRRDGPVQWMYRASSPDPSMVRQDVGRVVVDPDIDLDPPSPHCAPSSPPTCHNPRLPCIEQHPG